MCARVCAGYSCAGTHGRACASAQHQPISSGQGPWEMELHGVPQVQCGPKSQVLPPLSLRVHSPLSSSSCPNVQLFTSPPESACFTWENQFQVILCWCCLLWLVSFGSEMKSTVFLGQSAQLAQLCSLFFCLSKACHLLCWILIWVWEEQGRDSPMLTHV